MIPRESHRAVGNPPQVYPQLLLPRSVVSALIRCYQVMLSPDHGVLLRWAFPYGCCRYHPTCSEYGRRAVLRYGVIMGLGKTAWRVLRCNPLANGGVDEP